MIKIVAFFLLLLALAFGFSRIADQTGFFLLQWGEVEYRVSLIAGVLGLFAITLGLMLVLSVLRIVLRLPSLIGFSNRMRKRARGQAALARGLMAVGVGDQRRASRHAGEARALLGKDPLALLLSAQAAQLSGDAKGAEAAFTSMLDTPDAAGLGLRGLYIEAERRGAPDEARHFAEEAYRLSPEAPWAGAALLGFRAAARDWAGAIAILDQGVSRRVIDRAEGRRQRAVLLAAQAEDMREQNPDQAFSLAQDALRITPGLVPAAVLVGQHLSHRNDYAKAARTLEAAWKLLPHPDLAEAYLAVRAGDSALDRFKRAKTLQKLTPQAREACFAVARAALDAREFGAAREALDQLVLEKATMRACLLMAELKESENGNQGLVRAWLARASLAPRDPAWVADGVVSERWLPVSPVTGRIGAFEWITPPQAREATLRARIEADRFSCQPPVVEAEALPAPEPPTDDAPMVATNPVEDIKPEQAGPEPVPPKRGFRFFR